MPGGAFFHSFIDPEKWNGSGWLGTTYLYDPGGIEPPGLAFIFENVPVGRSIFEGWRSVFGKVDSRDLLRISVVEGDIPGHEPGYSLHISDEPANVLAFAREQGINDISTLATVGQVKRHDHPDSYNLHRFKEHYAVHGRYFIAPASWTGREPRTDFDLAIFKTLIYFRRASEIPPDDIDRAVFVV